MKTILCVLLALIATTMANESHPRSQHEDSTVPAFIWSGSSYFNKGSNYVKATLSPRNIDDALNVLAGGSSELSNKLIDLMSEEKSPEAIILFVEPELRTDLITKHAANLPNIQKLIKKAKSSVEAPYILASSSESILTPALTQLSSSINRIILARDESDKFEDLTATKLRISELSSFLVSSDVFTNEKVDLIVVCFDESAQSELSSALAEHDDIIAKVMAVVPKDFVAVYTADTITPSTHVWTHATKQRYAYSYHNLMANNTNGSGNHSNHTTHKLNYFPGAFLEVIIVSAALLAMLFSGGCALFGLQTPDRWDPPKQLKVKEI